VSAMISDQPGLAILVVEDDSSVRFTLQELLKGSYSVTLVSNVDEALATLAERTFDIALVDDRLPRAEGVELLTLIREKWPDTLRLLMSAWIDPERLLKGINEGQLYGFVEKPVEPGKLFALLLQCALMVTMRRQRDLARVGLQDQNKALEYLVEERTRKLEERNKKLEVLVTQDPLTGLHNRRYMEDRMDEELARFQRYETPFSLVMFDIDRFKLVNDTFGHAAGDHVLEQIADTLRNNVRKGDLVSRFGGEEFLCLLPVTRLEPAIATANRLRMKVGSLTTPLIEAMQTRSVTISGGVTDVRAEDKDWKQILKRADDALYEAKAAGRNCIRPE
jgi:diguanylate cyclase (GGDEF)-like protein